MQSEPQIVFVDDEPAILDGIRRMLRPKAADWSLHFVHSVDQALDLVRSIEADLIISDVSMPMKTGLDLLAALKEEENLSDIPVIMLTGNAEQDLKRHALELGALDLLNKPVTIEDLLARISSALRVRECQRQLQIQNDELEDRVKERTQSLEFAQLEVISRLARAGEYRDEDTGAHVSRVARCSLLLAEHLNMPDAHSVFCASPLHDIGKIGIPDSILLKPGRLTEEERRVIETHCQIGRDILSGPVQNENGKTSNNVILQMAAEIAYCHHERWNGTGYPRGISGTCIPLAARIVAVVDVLDALCHERPYKAAIPFPKSKAMIIEDSGSHFDPDVILAFEDISSELEQVMNEPDQALDGYSFQRFAA